MSVLSAVVVQVQNYTTYDINPCNSAHGLELWGCQQICVCQWTCIAADSLFELCCVVERLPLHSALYVILINTEKKRVKLNGRYKKEREF